AVCRRPHHERRRHAAKAGSHGGTGLPPAPPTTCDAKTAEGCSWPSISAQSAGSSDRRISKPHTAVLRGDTLKCTARHADGAKTANFRHFAAVRVTKSCHEPPKRQQIRASYSAKTGSQLWQAPCETAEQSSVWGLPIRRDRALRRM